jgi:vacuolar-type H+-ATPase subunit H
MRKHIPERDVDTADVESASVDDYGHIGEHVAAVLRAAESAAMEITARAEEDAAKQVSEAARQAGMILHEAEGIRAETEDANRLQREQADAYAERTRKDAEVKAADLLQAARLAVTTRAHEDEERQRVLRKDIDLTEARLSELGTGLRDLAARLEELVATDRPTADAPAERPGDDDPSLDAALMATVTAEEKPG